MVHNAFFNNKHFMNLKLVYRKMCFYSENSKFYYQKIFVDFRFITPPLSGKSVCVYVCTTYHLVSLIEIIETLSVKTV